MPQKERLTVFSRRPRRAGRLRESRGRLSPGQAGAYCFRPVSPGAGKEPETWWQSPPIRSPSANRKGHLPYETHRTSKPNSHRRFFSRLEEVAGGTVAGAFQAGALDWQKAPVDDDPSARDVGTVDMQAPHRQTAHSGIVVMLKAASGGGR
jgi:hypothetical protein